MSGPTTRVVLRTSSAASRRAGSDSDNNDGGPTGIGINMVRVGLTRNGGKKKTKEKKKTENAATISVVGLFLLAGLFFCVLDCFYIFHFMTTQRFHDNDTNQKEAAVDKMIPSRNNIVENENAVAEAVDAVLNDPDRAPILQLLRDAQLNISSLDVSKLQQIPKWSHVTALYGSEPVFVGLETCASFQQSADPEDHVVSTAGTFNTGTNLMAELLIANCHMPLRMAKYGSRQRGVRWQVLWGKHTPVFNETFRQEHRTYNDSSLNANHIFPAVMVRDPLKWMQSMCRHEYSAHWPHSKDRCPNLVFPENNTGVPVQIQYNPTFATHHNTLVGFWNDWYNQYTSVAWPRLMVRLEDLVFFPKQVTQTVCECAGGELNTHRPFQFITESAKRGSGQHGSESERTTYLDALIKYGTEKGRYSGYEEKDLHYAQEHLDPHLMNLFQYKLPPPTAPPLDETAVKVT